MDQVDLINSNSFGRAKQDCRIALKILRTSMEMRGRFQIGEKKDLRTSPGAVGFEGFVIRLPRRAPGRLQIPK
jgi:hypothetical protein